MRDCLPLGESESMNYKSSLDAYAMYYDIAKKSVAQLQSQMARVQRAKQELKDCDAVLREIEAEQLSEKQLQEHDQYEHLCIQIEQLGLSLAAEYGSLFQSICVTHVMCGACIEAIINQVAREELPSSEFDQFDKLSPYGKWLLLPKLCRVEFPDASDALMARLKRLVSRRNSLVHYKPKQGDWYLTDEPDFVETLGLTTDEAEYSLQSTAMLIEELHQAFNLERPVWLDADGELGYFEISTSVEP